MRIFLMVLFVGLLSTLHARAEISDKQMEEAIDAKVIEFRVNERSKLAFQTGKDVSLYAGTLRVRTFEDGFVVARKGKNGVEVEIHILAEQNPQMSMPKPFKQAYKRLGGDAVFGATIEGPVQFFGGDYRVFVCRKGLLFRKPDGNKSGPQAVLPEKPFQHR